MVLMLGSPHAPLFQITGWGPKPQTHRHKLTHHGRNEVMQQQGRGATTELDRCNQKPSERKEKSERKGNSIRIAASVTSEYEHADCDKGAVL